MSYPQVIEAPTDDFDARFGEWDEGLSFESLRYPLDLDFMPVSSDYTGFTNDFTWQDDAASQAFQACSQATPPQRALFSMQQRGVPTMTSGDDCRHLSPILFPTLGPNNPPAAISPGGSDKHNIRKVDVAKDDLYRPRWIRKEGSSREGWCGYCKPGVWANLKHSNYSYHLLTRHGLCKRAIGKQLEPPQGLRLLQCQSDHDSNASVPVLQAFCQHCHIYIQLSGNPTLPCDYQRLTASWYTHAKECFHKGCTST